MQHIMRDDVRRRATFGITMENKWARFWYCDRSVIATSVRFDVTKVMSFHSPPSVHVDLTANSLS
jgi:hypothetical protein